MFDDLTHTPDAEKLVRLEKGIRHGLRAFADVGNALLQIRDEKLYRHQYPSFEEYCSDKWDLDHSHAYRLMHAAAVVENLKSSPIGELLPANEAQARPLALLPADQQPEAWNKAVESAPKGKKPSASLVQKVVDAIRAKSGKERRMVEASEGWTHDELERDVKLMDSFTAIALTYGNEDAKAIRTGLVQLNRNEVLFLAKLSSEKMLEIRDLIMARHWTPKKAIEFVNNVPVHRSTLEDMQIWCLKTKQKLFTADLGVFTHSCKWNGPPGNK